MAGIPKELQEVLFERSIPGQSLTNPIEQRYPWEQPPQMTSVKEAREKIFLNLLEPNKLRSVQELMMDNIPVNVIAEVILTEAFRKGKFNPDMMLNLLEPTMYMLMAIAEKSGIEPVVETDIEEDDEEVIQKTLNKRKEFLKEEDSFRDVKLKNIRSMSVGEKIKEQLENLDGAKLRASLLEKREPRERTSLLEK
jgi:hypothetical protein